MKIQAVFGCLYVVTMALHTAPCLAFDAPDAEALVARLPFSSAGGPNIELERAIAALGETALPSLEKELRPGIRFRELNGILRRNGSRRYATVRVLARIDSPNSTDLLVRSLADPPDNEAMQYAILQALDKRTLSSEHVVAMLGNSEPRIVLAGLVHAKNRTATPAIKTAVERVFDTRLATAQFHNEYGAFIASAESLWDVRCAAGAALGLDMTGEMRLKAREILAALKRESLHLSSVEEAEWTSYLSRTERVICDSFDKLATLGAPIEDIVQSESKTAKGDYGRVLAMALARLGDVSRLPEVIRVLTASPDHAMRFCAADTLRALQPRSAIPALRRALHDPYHRQSGACIRTGDGEIYPVRIAASGALIALGEDPKAVLAAMEE